jgi:hypothetical protein
MKKLLKFLVVLLLLGIIAVLAIGFFLGPIVTKAVNAVGPKITGTRVELAEAKVSPLSGAVVLSDLFVGNPAGWTGDKAFSLGTMRASVDPISLLGDHVRVKEVFIDGPEFVFEKRLLGGSNVDALLQQIESNTGGGTREPSATEPAPGEEPKPMKFAVERFRLQNATMLLVVGGQTVPVPLPPLTIENLGVEEGGITADQVASRVLKQVLAQMGTAAAGAAKDIGVNVLEGGKDGAKSAGEAAKGALDKLLGR